MCKRLLRGRLTIAGCQVQSYVDLFESVSCDAWLMRTINKRYTYKHTHTQGEKKERKRVTIDSINSNKENYS